MTSLRTPVCFYVWTRFGMGTEPSPTCTCKLLQSVCFFLAVDEVIEASIEDIIGKWH